jgi:hypothetical protein
MLDFACFKGAPLHACLAYFLWVSLFARIWSESMAASIVVRQAASLLLRPSGGGGGAPASSMVVWGAARRVLEGEARGVDVVALRW